jgi:predicted ribosomally synthesized peptide with nif11-like leader
MSKENLDQFIQKVTNSEELQARIGEEIDADSLIALGAENGCEFSAEDLAADVELSDEELDGVNGGPLSVYTNVASFRLDGTKKFRWSPEQRLEVYTENQRRPHFSNLPSGVGTRYI